MAAIAAVQHPFVDSLVGKTGVPQQGAPTFPQCPSNRPLGAAGGHVHHLEQPSRVVRAVDAADAAQELAHLVAPAPTHNSVLSPTLPHSTVAPPHTNLPNPTFPQLRFVLLWMA